MRDRSGRVFAVLDVDYQVDVYLAQLARLCTLVLGTSALGGLAALALGLILACRVTEPVSALTRGVARVTAGDLSQPLPVRSQDDVGQRGGRGVGRADRAHLRRCY